jgi:hypothetical protein
MQTPGLPDLWLVNSETGDALWWETKAPRNKAGAPHKLRPEQAKFRQECIDTGVMHGWGTQQDAEQWLQVNGYGTRHPNGFVRRRLSEVCRYRLHEPAVYVHWQVGETERPANSRSCGRGVAPVTHGDTQ